MSGMKEAKKAWKKELVDRGWPNEFRFDFNVNDWGSCQYSSALAIYELYFRMREDLSQEDILELLEVEYTHNGRRTFQEIIDKFSKDMDEYYSHELYGRTEVEREHLKEEISIFLSIDDIFKFLKNQSWDLWGTSSHVIELVYKDFKLKDVPKSEGHGPEGNIIVQSGNFMTGLECALLFDNGVIQNFYSFANFDT